MKKPSFKLIVIFFIFMSLYYLYLTTIFILYFGFYHLKDSSGNELPVFFNKEDLNQCRLLFVMFSLIAICVFLQLISFVTCIILFSSSQIKRKKTATILAFLFYFLIFLSISAEYKISYIGGTITSDPYWVEPTLINKYNAYFEASKKYLYLNYLDPYSLLAINSVFLIIMIMLIIISSNKVKNYNNYLKQQENTTDVLPNSYVPTQGPTYIINNPGNNYPGIPPQIISPQREGVSKIINNIPLEQYNISKQHNISEKYNEDLQHNNSEQYNNLIDFTKINNLTLSQEAVKAEKFCERQRVTLPLNNVFINKILREKNMHETKFLINKLNFIDTEEQKTDLLVLIYKSCLNNDYCTPFLHKSIFEKIGSKLPSEFHQTNTEKSINYLLSHNLDAYKKLMYNLITLI